MPAGRRNDDGEAWANPGSMTASCGCIGDNGFLSYTGAAASLPGESVFDLDMERRAWWCCRGCMAGAPVLLAFQRTAGDFLTPIGEVPGDGARGGATSATRHSPLKRRLAGWGD